MPSARFSTALAFAALSACLHAGPSAKVEGEDSADFGSYPAKEGRTAAFAIANKGDAPLKILEVRNTCECIKTALTKDVNAGVSSQNVAPGAKTDFKIEVIADSIYERYSKTVYVRTDDPANSLLAFTVSGDPIPILAVKAEDRMIYAGRLKEGAEWRKDILLKATQDGVETGVPEMKSPLPGVARIEKAGGRAFLLTLILKPPESSLGEFQCKVVVPVKKPEGWKALEVDVAGTVGAELVSTPGRLTLPADAKYPLEMEVELRLLSPDGRSLSAGELSAKAIGTAMSLSQKSPGVVSLRVKFREAPSGGFAIEAWAPKAKPLKIPVSAGRVN